MGHPKRSKQILGNVGEKVAAGYFERKGYEIVARNWRCRAGEVDLIVQKGIDLVFVEVRTRSSSDHGHPLDTIQGPKQRQVVRVARHYLENRNLTDQVAVRFDAVGVLTEDDGLFSIEHVENAFEDYETGRSR